MALLKKPKAKLISVQGAQAKAPAANKRARAVKPGKKDKQARGSSTKRSSK